MIQRVQTLFLAGVVILSIALYFIPLSEKTVIDPSGKSSTQTLLLSVSALSPTEVAPGQISNYALLIFNLVIILIAGYAIFLYKNRSLQIKLCMLGGLLATVQLILIFYYSEAMGSETTEVHYLAGVYLVAIQVFLLMAARRAIRKDDMMVKAADRIR